ncbi:MAG: pyridoxamine 5'-phosphate oxidase [Phycisphaerales bacterium]
MSTGQERTNDNLQPTRATSAQGPSREHLSGPLDAVHAFNTTHDEHLPDRLPEDPFPLLNAWVDQATRDRVQPNPTAIALATTSDNGMPNVRIVLCRGIDIEQGSIWFFTNGRSVKGEDIAANPKAAAAFHWDSLDRQARLRGVVEPLPAKESDAYFQGRRWEKRVGAWASDQSQPVASREALLEKLESTLRRFGIDPKNPPPADAEIDIPRPPHWGGFRIIATEVELWVGSPARMHDRARWTRPDPEHPWSATRLQP